MDSVVIKDKLAKKFAYSLEDHSDLKDFKLKRCVNIL